MLWPFIAICLSTWLFINASHHGPDWQCVLFKPITLLLLLLLAWQAPMLTLIDYLIIASLCTSLVGDILSLISYQYLIYATNAFLLSRLFYAIYFVSQIKQMPFWLIILTLLTVSTLLISVIWTKLKNIFWLFCAFITMELIIVWLASKLWLFRQTASTVLLFLGTVLLLINSSIWSMKCYYHHTNIHNVFSVICYFTGHFLIVNSLYL